MKIKMPPRLQFVKWVGLLLAGIGVACIMSAKRDHLTDTGSEYIHVGLAFWAVAMIAQGIVDELRKK
jgi:Na+/phosphate symporter